MRILLVSDLHVDFYVPMSSNAATLRPHFDMFYDRYLSPADAICVAGDVANDHGMQELFLEYLSTRYGSVYYVFGNHDIIVSHGTFIPSPFATSEERIAHVKEFASRIPNLYVLDGDVSPDGLVGGTMGMCDLTYRAPGWEGFAIDQFWRSKWFDGRNWKYRGQVFGDILEYEMEKLRTVCEAKPHIVMTHFCPLQMGIADRYVGDPVTAVFYFDASRFLPVVSGSIWQCGHTHLSYDVEHDGVRIVCNPLGYPEELNSFVSGRDAGSFVIEV